MGWLELLMVIGAWGVLGAVFLLLVCVLFDGRSVLSISIGLFALGFFARAVMILLNEEFVFLAPKLAGTLAITVFNEHILHFSGWQWLLENEFAAQACINTPVWILFGPSRIALLLSNATLGALAGPLAGVLLYRHFDWPAAQRAMIVLSLYPSNFNFSIFGLRDPIIFLGMLVAALAVARIWADRRSFKNYLLFGCGAWFVLWSRPELVYVILVLSVIPVMNFYVNVAVAAVRSRQVFKSLLVLTVPLVVIAVLGVLGATRIAAYNIGARTANPAEIADQYASDRFERHDASLGGGSHMLSSETYRNLPWYLRVPVQTAGLIVLPFPWRITNPLLLLTFGDSMFLIVFIAATMLNAWYCQPIRNSGFSRLALFLLLASFIGVVGLAFIVSNFGNGFRMRYAVTPMIFVAAAVCPIRVNVVLFARQRTKLPVMNRYGTA